MWLLRFSLGLPARKKDIQALRKDIPELFRSNISELPNKYFHFQYSYFCNLPKDRFWNALQQWIANYDDRKEDKFDLPNQNIQNCPAEFCPLRGNKSEEYDNSSSNKDEFNQQHSANNPQNTILEVMHIGGGKDRKPPLNQFLDLVKQCHKDLNGSNIREVIVTDPYILYPVNDKGVGGGYDNFIKYLDALGLNDKSKFEMKFARGGDSDKRKNLEKTLENYFSSIDFKSLSSNLEFHDRFYLVRYKAGTLKGVFGPSLNGLSANSIVLMGELEENTLKWLDRRI